jgi:hypothetical protein
MAVVNGLVGYIVAFRFLLDGRAELY